MRITLLALVSLAATTAFASSNTDYIALGDSIGFGFQPIPPYTTTPSYGDQGYVQYVAKYLAGDNGGVLPNVFNLSIPDETSSSFFDTSNPYRIANLNYTAPVSQAALFNSTVASEEGLGHTISTVTFALGANDLLGLLTPTFLSESFAMQEFQVQQTLQTVQNNLVASLTDIRTELPTSKLILVGYYNPYDLATIPPTEVALTNGIVGELNSELSGDAAAFGGTYVDVQSAFSGHIAQYTWMDTALQDIHPNDLGYSVIANQIKPNVVPAPGAALAMLTGLIAMRRKRK
jgi:lysophospholipase L1-like esterase